MKRIFSTALITLAACVMLTGCLSAGAAKSVTIASKTFTENILLSEMYAQLIENRTNIKVTRKQSLGGTPICYTAMKNGDVDIYVDYTGTLYSEILRNEYDPNVMSDDIYTSVKEALMRSDNITVFSPIGLNNSYAIAMQDDKAEALGIVTMSDLRAYAPRMVFAANELFYTRINDGYDAMTKKYGYAFRSAAKMNTSQIYDEISDGRVDVMVVYATDSHLRKYSMAVLEDDLKLFPAYYGLPIARNEVLKRFPELNDLLELLAGRIDNERMQELNYQADVENKSPEEIAHAFLTEEGLLK